MDIRDLTFDQYLVRCNDTGMLCCIYLDPVTIKHCEYAAGIPWTMPDDFDPTVRILRTINDCLPRMEDKDV